MTSISCAADSEHLGLKRPEENGRERREREVATSDAHRVARGAPHWHVLRVEMRIVAGVNHALAARSRRRLDLDRERVRRGALARDLDGMVAGPHLHDLVLQRHARGLQPQRLIVFAEETGHGSERPFVGHGEQRERPSCPISA